MATIMKCDRCGASAEIGVNGPCEIASYEFSQRAPGAPSWGKYGVALDLCLSCADAVYHMLISLPTDKSSSNDGLPAERCGQQRVR